MRVWKIALLILVISLLLIPACSLFGGGQTTEIQQAEMVRGDLSVKVNGSGKTAVATDAKLAFNTGGKVEKVLVKKNDRVTKNAVLAKLETDNLELAVSQAETALAQARLAQTQAEVAQTQAETALEVAKFNLDKIKDVSDLKDKVTDVQWRITIAEEKQKESAAIKDDRGVGFWITEIGNLRRELAIKQKDLADLLGKQGYAGVVSYDVLSQKYDRVVVEDVRTKQLQVTTAEKSIQQARDSVEYARSNVALTQKSLAVAQKQLKDATLVAPIDGVIATLDVKEGDIITPLTLGAKTVIYLIDPGTMELNIDVDEIDVSNVRLNQRAIISLDAQPEVKLEGKVTAIALVPTIQSGVVVYETKVAFGVPPAIELRVGMSATVDIVVNERKNVLLVPNRAIKQDSQNNTTVEVVAGEKTDERTVVLGLSDGVSTEVISGLKEGERVVTGRIKRQSGFFLQ